jgi:hypothetical protein
VDGATLRPVHSDALVPDGFGGVVGIELFETTVERPKGLEPSTLSFEGCDRIVTSRAKIAGYGF